MGNTQSAARGSDTASISTSIGSGSSLGSITSIASNATTLDGRRDLRRGGYLPDKDEKHRRSQCFLCGFRNHAACSVDTTCPKCRRFACLLCRARPQPAQPCLACAPVAPLPSSHLACHVCGCRFRVGNDAGFHCQCCDQASCAACQSSVVSLTCTTCMRFAVADACTVCSSSTPCADLAVCVQCERDVCSLHRCDDVPGPVQCSDCVRIQRVPSFLEMQVVNVDVDIVLMFSSNRVRTLVLDLMQPLGASLQVQMVIQRDTGDHVLAGIIGGVNVVAVHVPGGVTLGSSHAARFCFNRIASWFLPSGSRVGLWLEEQRVDQPAADVAPTPRESEKAQQKGPGRGKSHGTKSQDKGQPRDVGMHHWLVETLDVEPTAISLVSRALALAGCFAVSGAVLDCDVAPSAVLGVANLSPLRLFGCCNVRESTAVWNIMPALNDVLGSVHMDHVIVNCPKLRTSTLHLLQCLIRNKDRLRTVVLPSELKPDRDDFLLFAATMQLGVIEDLQVPWDLPFSKLIPLPSITDSCQIAETFSLPKLNPHRAYRALVRESVSRVVTWPFLPHLRRLGCTNCPGAMPLLRRGQMAQLRCIARFTPHLERAIAANRLLRTMSAPFSQFQSKFWDLPMLQLLVLHPAHRQQDIVTADLAALAAIFPALRRVVVPARSPGLSVASVSSDFDILQVRHPDVSLASRPAAPASAPSALVMCRPLFAASTLRHVLSSVHVNRANVDQFAALSECRVLATLVASDIRLDADALAAVLSCCLRLHTLRLADVCLVLAHQHQHVTEAFALAPALSSLELFGLTLACADGPRPILMQFNLPVDRMGTHLRNLVVADASVTCAPILMSVARAPSLEDPSIAEVFHAMVESLKLDAISNLQGSFAMDSLIPTIESGLMNDTCILDYVLAIPWEMYDDAAMVPCWTTIDLPGADVLPPQPDLSSCTVLRELIWAPPVVMPTYPSSLRVLSLTCLPRLLASFEFAAAEAFADALLPLSSLRTFACRGAMTTYACRVLLTTLLSLPCVRDVTIDVTRPIPRPALVFPHHLESLEFRGCTVYPDEDENEVYKGYSKVPGSRDLELPIVASLVELAAAVVLQRIGAGDASYAGTAGTLLPSDIAVPVLMRDAKRCIICHGVFLGPGFPVITSYSYSSEFILTWCCVRCFSQFGWLMRDEVSEDPCINAILHDPSLARHLPVGPAYWNLLVAVGHPQAGTGPVQPIEFVF